MDEQGIVIVDDSGHEYEFPAGMDPKRAIQIVKSQQLKAANAKPLKEPTTYWGGVLKGLNSYADELGRGMFESAAHPQTAGDFLGLMMPSVLSMKAASAAEALPRGVEPNPIVNRAVRAGARGAANVMDLTPNIVASKTEGRIVDKLRAFGEKQPTQFKDLPLAQQMDELPTNRPNPIRRQSGPVGQPVAKTEFKDLPLYKQQEILEQTGTKTAAASGSSRMGDPVVSPISKTGPVGKVVGKAPTLEEELQNALMEQMGGSDAPIVTTGAPEIETAGEGPTHQSGQFGKSQSLGQPGGYSSGRPPLTEGQYQDLLDRVGGRGEDVGAGQPNDTPPAASKPKLSAQEVAEGLRRMYGSRDGGAMLYGSSLSPAERAAAIKRLAPGPSRLPLTAEERISGGGRTSAEIADDLLMQLLNKDK